MFRVGRLHNTALHIQILGGDCGHSSNYSGGCAGYCGSSYDRRRSAGSVVINSAYNIRSFCKYSVESSHNNEFFGSSNCSSVDDWGIGTEHY